MPTLIPDLSRTALLSMDLQSSIVSIYTKGNAEFLARAASVLQAARSRAICVTHVKLEFRPGLPEVSTRNPLFAGIKNSAQWQQIFQGTAGAIHPSVAPQDGDIVVTKRRVSAFAGTDLELILGAHDIETLILMGIATSGVVLSTLLHAGDADYRVLVIKDCCADLDLEVHNCLVEKIFPRLATVVSAAELLEALQSK